MRDPTTQEPSKADILWQAVQFRSRRFDGYLHPHAVSELRDYAKTLESEAASLRAQLAEAREIIASQCFNVGHSMYPVYKLSNRDCGGSSEWGENKCSRCGKSESWQYDF